MLRACLAAVLVLFLTAVHSRAETPAIQLMGDRLRAGEIAALHADLVQRLTANPSDDQVRLALGTAEFLIAVEHLSQAMYRHGLAPHHEIAANLPFFRFPLPPNPNPEPLTYETMRAVFKTALADFSRAEATLAQMGTAEVKLPVAIGLARLDLDGDGTATDQEALWRVLDATLGGGNIPDEAAERFIIAFDRGDAAWLRGYTHLLSAMLEFGLAHDWQVAFDTTFHMIFPGAALPNAVLNDYTTPSMSGFAAGPIADFIAFIHLAHWPVTEPERMRAALGHLESMVALSRESWRFIASEADDEAEWIPSPRQKNGVLPAATVTQQTVDGWMVFLTEFEAILQGKKLVPHWRLNRGINLRRVFTEPRSFDPILWAQGSAALPYLEDGPMTDAQTWGMIMMMFEGNFLGYAVWFN